MTVTKTRNKKPRRLKKAPAGAKAPFAVPKPLSEAEEANLKAFVYKFKPDATWTRGEGSYSLSDGQISLSFGHCLTPRSGSIWLLKGEKGAPEKLISFPVKYASPTAVGDVDEIIRQTISDWKYACEDLTSNTLKQFMENLNLDRARLQAMLDEPLEKVSTEEGLVEDTGTSEVLPPASEKPWWTCVDPCFAPFTAEEARSMLLRVLAERRRDQLLSSRRA